MVEFWRAGGSATTIEAAKAAEAEDWDGQMFRDSLAGSPDPFVTMAACAMATERLKLATGVSNPLTRPVAVMAAAAATVQAISGGRVVLGVGRGGLAPVPLATFERGLSDLQTLLRGGKILAFGPHMPAEAAGLEWLSQDLPKTPLDVAATGPKVIELAAPVAERVTFSVGAIAERIDWALGIARAARDGAGLGDAGVSYGAQVIVVCHPDRATALEFAGHAVPALARFQVMQGPAAGPLSPNDAENLAALRRGGPLTSEFLQRFAIVGPPDVCIERLLQLVQCGLERFVVVGPGLFPEPGGAGRSLFASVVMPAVRAAVGG